jgi:hypothetical protein
MEYNICYHGYTGPFLKESANFNIYKGQRNGVDIRTIVFNGETHMSVIEFTEDQFYLFVDKLKEYF